MSARDCDGHNDAVSSLGSNRVSHLHDLPIDSCPRMSMFSMVGKTCRSEPQIAVDVILMMASRGSQSLGQTGARPGRSSRAAGCFHTRSFLSGFYLRQTSN